MTGTAGTGTAAETLRARDERVFFYRKLPTGTYLRHAAGRSGRSPVALTVEFSGSCAARAA